MGSPRGKPVGNLHEELPALVNPVGWAPLENVDGPLAAQEGHPPAI